MTSVIFLWIIGVMTLKGVYFLITHMPLFFKTNSDIFFLVSMSQNVFYAKEKRGKKIISGDLEFTNNWNMKKDYKHFWWPLKISINMDGVVFFFFLNSWPWQLSWYKNKWFNTMWHSWDDANMCMKTHYIFSKVICS